MMTRGGPTKAVAMFVASSPELGETIGGTVPDTHSGSSSRLACVRAMTHVGGRRW